jgi:carbon storage regulator
VVSLVGGETSQRQSSEQNIQSCPGAHNFLMIRRYISLRDDWPDEQMADPFYPPRSAKARQTSAGKDTTMLVLSRKLGETITIGDDVRVTILHVAGGRVRLGIEAPVDVPVHRAELRAKIENALRGGENAALFAH